MWLGEAKEDRTNAEKLKYLPHDEAEPLTQTFFSSVNHEPNTIGNALINDYPHATVTDFKYVEIPSVQDEMIPDESAGYHVKVTLKPKKGETKVEVAGPNHHGDISTVHIHDPHMVISGVTGIGIDTTVTEPQYDEFTNVIEMDVDGSMEGKEKVYTWIRPAAELPQEDDIVSEADEDDDDFPHLTLDARLDGVASTKEVVTTDKHSKKFKNRHESKVVPAPSLAYGGAEYERPAYGGRLDPKGFALHAIEVHQMVNLPTEDGVAMNEPPWFQTQNLDLNKDCAFGPIALPWDPSHTGMVAPMCHPRPPSGGPIRPMLSETVAKLFPVRWPVKSLLGVSSAFSCCTVLKASKAGLPLSRKEIPIDDGLVLFDDTLAMSESVPVDNILA